ncbi:glycosyltransferase family 2 protein [Flavobacterium sp.]|uniref:glycosyltransferase family 2 protein n=1 Tax=Flavobacterium sp. TaxID=239 RepID=UPI00375280C8
MIIIYHDKNKIKNVISSNNLEITFKKDNSIIEVIQGISIQYPSEKIAWCNQFLHTKINLDFIKNQKINNNTIKTYNPFETNYLTNAIGYVENSPFININKKITYPTWQMSSHVGFANAALFLDIKNKIKNNKNFDYYINSISKIYQPLGLFCYSEPQLLLDVKNIVDLKNINASNFKIFKFIKQHNKSKWVFLLFIDYVVFNKKFPFLALLNSLFFKQIKISKYEIPKTKDDINTIYTDSIDVLIPTIGRKKYLYDVLCDLKNQTYLPKNVIIVEQNAIKNSSSELDYILTEPWPFQIKHFFTNTLGACNARNIALDKIESDWIFFADDDIRFDANFLNQCLHNCKVNNIKAATLASLKQGEQIPNINPSQWESFGTCSSFVLSSVVKKIRFDLGFEFGYSEDIDFGKKIRNQGADISFLPFPRILHLKAPIGGFRTKFVFDWEKDEIQPKPSPTVMLYKILHCTDEEINGFKTVLFFKFYKKQNIKNPIKYFNYFNKQWNQSIKWAKELKNKSQ